MKTKQNLWKLSSKETHSGYAELTVQSNWKERDCGSFYKEPTRSVEEALKKSKTEQKLLWSKDNEEEKVKFGEKLSTINLTGKGQLDNLNTLLNTKKAEEESFERLEMD